MVAKRKALNLNGQLQLAKRTLKEGWIAPPTIGQNAVSKDWLLESTADFSEFVFSGFANFTGFVFPGVALFGDNTLVVDNRSPFRSTIFHEEVRFRFTVFCLDAIFDCVTFLEKSRFSSAVFRGDASFGEALFEKSASFYNAKFEKEVWFGQTRFLSYSTFAKARFRSSPAFPGITSRSSFDLTYAAFEVLPDFTQANFSETPRLDSLILEWRVEPGGFFRSLFIPLGNAANVAAKYRALRRLALQGHDYENESMAFKGEVRARRLELLTSPGTLHSGLVCFTTHYRTLGGRYATSLHLVNSVVAFGAIYLWDAGVRASEWTARHPE